MRLLLAAYKELATRGLTIDLLRGTLYQLLNILTTLNYCNMNNKNLMFGSTVLLEKA